MKQIALNHVHTGLNAKMVEFQGWHVPLQYSSPNEEHQAVRKAAGLFDVSWLGRIEIAGKGAPDLLQKTFSRNVAKLPEGYVTYGLFCNEQGFILDDSVLMHLPDSGDGSRFLVCTNAINTKKIITWLEAQAGHDTKITDITEDTVHLALQGPRSQQIIEMLSSGHYKKIKQRHLRKASIGAVSTILSRTGYTGEHGYEIIAPAADGETVWNAIMEAGKDAGILPCGLAARDILRLEMGYPMYGADIDETRTPVEAGLTSFIDLKKDFIARDAILKLKSEGAKQRLAGFVLAEKAVPRAGNSIFSENREIGQVTSANYSPAIYKSIGLGYVLTRYAQAGQEIEIEAKDREIAARIVDLPFYKKNI